MIDPTDWAWDYWLADDGASYHLFFLYAARSLGDPELRHRNAAVGHATSTDLRSWVRGEDALLPSATPAFDDLAVWTGSVLRDDAGDWRMFYTGLSRADDGRVQRIGAAVSGDLMTWRRTAEPPVEADPRWYERFPAPGWPDESWRDPWVCRDADGTWHMYVTARAGTGRGLGVVGHARSADLRSWEVQPPLSTATGRFEWLEVVQLVLVEGRWALLFSCLSQEMVGAEPGSGGVWSVGVDGPGCPVDVARAVRLTSEDLYVGKVCQDRDGSPRFLAFENRDVHGRFAGGVIPPLPVGWNTDGTGLVLLGGEDRWRPPPGPGAAGH
jgi:beta-fructofuranosidase